MTIYNHYRQSIITGTMSERPPAGVPGREFVPTDGYGPTRQIDNGSSWEHYYNGFKCTNPPAYNSFTNVNFGSVATLAADGDGLLFTNVGSAGTGETHTMFLVSVPSPPYSLVVGFHVLFMHWSHYTEVGLVWADGTSNPKFQRFNYQQNQNGVMYINSVYNSNLTTWNATKISTYAPNSLSNNIYFMKLSDDNTNRKCWISNDGRNWGTTIDSQTRTDYFTPTHIGVESMQATTSIAATVTRLQTKIFHWSLG